MGHYVMVSLLVLKISCSLLQNGHLFEYISTLHIQEQEEELPNDSERLFQLL